MSELNNGGLNVPPDQDFDTVGFQGSMQQVLQENVGNYVIVEFLIGTGSLISRQGILYNVASQFLVLYDQFEARYVVCDIFSVKFVTFLQPNPRDDIPTPYPSADVPAGEAAAPTFSFKTPARAAYAHVTRNQRPV